MQQAYQNFNAGKYKQALNNLSVNSINIDSYEPNLAICEYLSNRCQQSSLNCLRKLNDLLARRLKRDPARTDSHTECIVKLNIAVLLILQGKRDNALVVLGELYRTRDCFIEFMQSRVFLLLLELNALAKNALEVLVVHRYYLLRPVEQRGQPQQWISILLHEHGKTFAVAREEFALMSRVYVVQALLQLGASAASLGDEQQKLREQLVGRVKRRKNALSKYYEINVAMIGRFLEAQKHLHAGQLSRCLSLMNFVNMVEDHEQMPTTKIITNILNAFATNNTGTVHFAYNKPTLALLHFAKAKALLAKACTGVEDKDLHLFSLNYGNHIESVTYNQALALLGSRPKQSYTYFESIRKSNQMSKNYKFWYRMGQAILQYYHHARTPVDQRKPLLQSALAAFTNCLICLDSTRLPTAAIFKNLTKFNPLPEEDIEAMVMRLRNEEQQFRQSIYTLICYVSLGLQLYRKVIKMAVLGLQQKKLDTRNRLNLLHYVMEAELALGKTGMEVRDHMDAIQEQMVSVPGMATEVRYLREKEEVTEEGDYETMYYHWVVKMQLGLGNLEEAARYGELMRLKHPTSLKASMRDVVQYLHIRIGLNKKFVHPYLKT